jgi:hypothetical protein
MLPEDRWNNDKTITKNNLQRKRIFYRWKTERI